MEIPKNTIEKKELGHDDVLHLGLSVGRATAKQCENALGILYKGSFDSIAVNTLKGGNVTVTIIGLEQATYDSVSNALLKRVPKERFSVAREENVTTFTMDTLPHLAAAINMLARDAGKIDKISHNHIDHHL